MADGIYHPAEDHFLRVTAHRLGFDDAGFARVRSRHVPDAWDPYMVLGLSESDGPEQAHAAWKRLVRENHPDLVYAAGLPTEMRRIADDRMRDINLAYEEVSKRSEKENRCPNTPCI
jgi:DnaJ like chaperone protein